LESDSTTALILAAVFLAAHAFFALAYNALTNARSGTLRDLVEDGNVRAAAVLKLTEGGDLSRLRLTYLLTSALLHGLTMAILTANLIQPLMVAEGISPFLAYLLTALVVVLVMITFGTLIPEALGTLHADRLSLWLAGTIRIWILLLSPITSVLTTVSQGVSALFGSDAYVNRVTEEEIMTMVDAAHTDKSIEENEADMIYSVLTLDETKSSELMTPRIDIIAVDIDTPLEEIDKVFVDSGYSRLPVYNGSIDHIEGVLMAKDVLRAYYNGNRVHVKSLRDLMRPVMYVPETKTADTLLREMRARRMHMAIVVDEYGGTAGLVTIEDLVEQIIGDIQDEFDDDEEAEYRLLDGDSYEVDAAIDIDDLNDLLDINLPTDDSDTLSGLIYTKLGRVPLSGEMLELYDVLAVTVDQIEGRRIRKATVKLLTPKIVDEPEAAKLNGKDSRAVNTDDEGKQELSPAAGSE
jgi:CBS domain containing-hemolysin-like protein